MKKDSRELGKWIFSIATLGLGGLYLWATTTVIQEGEIGLRRSATGKMVLLPPGRHSNFSWESYPADPQFLSNKTIKMGPYQIESMGFAPSKPVEGGSKQNDSASGNLSL